MSQRPPLRPSNQHSEHPWRKGWSRVWLGLAGSCYWKRLWSEKHLLGKCQGSRVICSDFTNCLNEKSMCWTDLYKFLVPILSCFMKHCVGARVQIQCSRPVLTILWILNAARHSKRILFRKKHEATNTGPAAMPWHTITNRYVIT